MIGLLPVVVEGAVIVVVVVCDGVISKVTIDFLEVEFRSERCRGLREEIRVVCELGSRECCDDPWRSDSRDG